MTGTNGVNGGCIGAVNGLIMKYANHKNVIAFKIQLLSTAKMGMMV